MFLWGQSKSAIEWHACGAHKKCISAGKRSQIHKTHKVFNRDCKSSSWTLIGREGPVSSTHNTVEYCFFPFLCYSAVTWKCPSRVCWVNHSEPAILNGGKWWSNISEIREIPQPGLGLPGSVVTHTQTSHIHSSMVLCVKIKTNILLTGCSEGMVHSRGSLASWLPSFNTSSLKPFWC